MSTLVKVGYLQLIGVDFFFAPELVKTLCQQSFKFLSAHDSILFVTTPGTPAIEKIAVYDIAINIIIYHTKSLLFSG